MANNLDNYIFVGTNGRVRALEILGGLRSSQPPGLRTVWTEQLKGMGYETIALHLAPSKSNNKESKQMVLYGATSGFVFALDPFTGRTIWKVKPAAQNGIMTSNPMTVHCTDDRSLIISGAKGAIVALDSTSGNQMWEYILDEFGSGSAFTFWERCGMLVVANLGKLTALDLSGRLIWENYLPGKGFASISMVAYPFNPPGVTNDTLIVGTAGFILVVDMRTGKIKREVNLEGAGFKPVALLLDNKADTILSATSGELRCFRGEGLQPLWKSDLKGMNYAFGHSLLFPNDHEIIIGMNGRVANLNRGTGLVEWMTSGCGSGVTSVALLSDPTLLVCAANGSLYILNKSDGRILMKDGLSGMGYGTFSLSTTVYNTDYNSTTLPHSIMEERRSST